MRESGVETNSSAAEKGSEARIVSVAARETTSRADRGSQEKTEQLAAGFARQPEPVVCERPERSRETEPPPSGKPSTYSMPAVGARGSLVHPADTEPPAKTAPETTVGINRHAPTTGERKSGELEAERERMMVEHLPIVRFLARRIHERLPQHVDMEDLVSAGVLGLMDALSKFDPEKKVQFRSYAQFRIRGAILDSLRTLDWSPRDLRRKGRAVEEAIRLLTARHGRPATEFEVAEEMHLPLAAYQQLLGELKGLEIGTLHMERSEDSGEEELAYIPNRPEDDPLFRCLRGEMRQRLADAIAELAERERLVMTLYYYEEMTMKEIGLTLGVVESRVSQIHASAVLHLRVLLSDLALRKGEGKPAARVREETRTPAASRQQRRI